MNTGDVRTVTNNSTAYCLGKWWVDISLQVFLSGKQGTFSYTKMKSIKHTRCNSHLNFTTEQQQ